MRNVSGVVKTSVVMISSAGEEGFYRSVQDVPEPLRARLIAVTNSANSGTIVIADRAGKEQINHAMTRREASREYSPNKTAALPDVPRLIGVTWVLWVAAFMLLLAAGVIAASFMTN